MTLLKDASHIPGGTVIGIWFEWLDSLSCDWSEIELKMKHINYKKISKLTNKILNCMEIKTK